jgi:DNA-binding GntR family transcriptional regulator
VVNRSEIEAAVLNRGPVNPWGGASRPSAFDVSGTIRDRVAFALRQRILNGQLAKGTRLELDELAAHYGTSRTPIREACLELSHEGLVEVAPRSGVTVVGVSVDDISDNFILMSTLGGLASQWVAERATDVQIAEIQRLHEDLRNTEEDDPRLVRRTWLFHRGINRACHSDRLLHLLRISGRLVPDGLAVAPEQVSCSRKEHAELVDALVRRDGAVAREVSEKHLLNAGRLWSEKYAAILRADALPEGPWD